MAHIQAGLRLVPPIVGRMEKHLDRARKDDLRSFGNEGALVAGRTYDPAFGVPFNRWATLKIRGAIFDGLRGEADLPRRLHARIRALLAANSAQEGFADDDGGAAPLLSAAAADARLDDRLASIATAYAAGALFARGDPTLGSLADGGPTPEEELENEQLTAAIRAAVAERPEGERTLLERYYFAGMTMSEASGGRSRSWASRLHARAIRGVARSLRRANGTPART
jgi:RNA polymerase sigma factor for flagellar operon FliA